MNFIFLIILLYEYNTNILQYEYKIYNRIYFYIINLH